MAVTVASKDKEYVLAYERDFARRQSLFVAI